MSSAREFSIRRGQRIAEVPGFSWTGAIPLFSKGFGDFSRVFLGVFLKVLRRFGDPPGSMGLYSAQSNGSGSVLFQAS